MCGITGFVNFDGHAAGEAQQRVGRMADAIAHRGPDADGFHVDDHAALGHRRLAIIDLKTGQQPMSILDGRLQIVFNGEIYNFQSVRRELESLGHTFRTNSDTEVILYAYHQWRDDCVARLFGMFALAIWDSTERRLFLARDRVGKKPLYVWSEGSTIAFASEIKALRAGGFDVGAIDEEALDCYLTMGYVPCPRTIFSGVRKLRPAHTLGVTKSEHSERHYWNLDFSAVRHDSLEESAEEFEQVFDEAVRCRLISDVPLGAFLSGGIDSSLVVSSMSRVMNGTVKTHTIGFDSEDIDEAATARAIAGHLETDHREFTVTPNVTDVLDRIAWHFDEPLADSSALPTWYVCEMTRQSVTVALSGDGGDEGFGGYSFRYHPHVFESTLRAALPPAVRSMLFGPIGALWPASSALPRPLRLKSILRNLAGGDVEAFFSDMTWLTRDNRSRVYRREFVDRLNGFDPIETVAPFYRSSRARDALSRAQYADINVYMTDDVLAKVDRMSMAHALEVRAPLLDHRVLEFAAGLARQLKLDMRKGKVLLRDVAGRRLPAAVKDLPKQGFSIPAARWLRTDLRSFVENLVFDESGIIPRYLDVAALRSLWDQHQRGRRDHNVFFWGLMMLALWERKHGDVR